MNKNSTAKIVVISLGGLILLWLINAILTGTGNGSGMYAGGNMMGYNHGGGLFMGNGVQDPRGIPQKKLFSKLIL